MNKIKSWVNLNWVANVYKYDKRRNSLSELDDELSSNEECNNKEKYI